MRRELNRRHHTTAGGGRHQVSFQDFAGRVWLRLKCVSFHTLPADEPAGRCSNFSRTLSALQRSTRARAKRLSSPSTTGPAARLSASAPPSPLSFVIDRIRFRRDIEPPCPGVSAGKKCALPPQRWNTCPSRSQAAQYFQPSTPQSPARPTSSLDRVVMRRTRVPSGPSQWIPGDQYRVMFV
jgi:hypothetical protein